MSDEYLNEHPHSDQRSEAVDSQQPLELHQGDDMDQSGKEQLQERGSGTILDQVDSYLNTHRHGSNDRGTDSPQWALASQYGNNDIDMDLDHLSHALLNDPHATQSGEEQRHESHGLLDHDSLTPAGMSGPSPSNFNLDFSLIEHNDKLHESNDHVRPDMVFSPMVSPMVMPTSSMHNTPFMGPSGIPHGSVQNTPYMGNSVPTTSVSSRDDRQSHHASRFSPLTSPALNAVEQQHQQQQQQFALPDSSISSSRKSSTANPRSKRTPHNTPSMVPTNPGSSSNKILKQSPHIASRRSISKYKGGSWDDMVFKLPDSSMKNDNNSPSTASNNAYTPNSTNSSNGSGLDRMTPSSMMNYPKVILPSNSNPISLSSDHTVMRATESPVIQPRKVVEMYATNLHESQSHSSAATSTASAIATAKKNYITSNDSESKNTGNGSMSHSPAAASGASSTKERSVPSANGNYSVTGSYLKTNGIKSSTNYDKDPKPSITRRSSLRDTTKLYKQKSSSEEDDENDDEVVKKQKQVHKAAEQGRRNRLNNALKDLDALLPKDLKDTVQIPSKATTVELAAQYIRYLRDKVDKNR